MLGHLGLISELSEDRPIDKRQPTTAATVIFIWDGLPPMTQKLVLCIQAWEYVDMAELLPDRLGINAGAASGGGQGGQETKAPPGVQHTGVDPVLLDPHGSANLNIPREDSRYAGLPGSHRGSQDGV